MQNNILKNWTDLTINEKIFIKQVSMKKWGKRNHFNKPNELSCLTDTQINYLLSETI